MRIRTLRNAADLLIVLSALIFLFTNSEKTAEFTLNAVNLCLKRVIPSLFPFLVIAAVIVKMGLPQKLGTAAGAFFERWLGISGAGAAVILLGMITGFPTGASAAAELYKTGGCSKEEAQRLLPLANNPSPAFILAVSTGVFHNRASAALLLAASCFTTLWLAALSGKKSGNRESALLHGRKTGSFLSSFASACESAGRSVLLICAYVVLFSAATGFLPGIPLLRGIAELTGGMYAFTEWNAETAAHSAFLLGFGGLCVAAQSFCFAEEAGISMKYYLPVKLCHGLMLSLNVFAVLKLKYWAILPAIAEAGLVLVKNSGKKAKYVLYSR